MEKVVSNVQHLAAYSLMKGLYNSGKRDIFEILLAFVKETIIDEAIYETDSIEMANKLKTRYSINVPSGVINTVLKKVDGYRRENKKFYFDKRDLIKSEIKDELTNKIASMNKNIIEKLIAYFELKEKRSITIYEKERLLLNFNLFLLMESNGHEYTEFISAFIIENSIDADFVSQLDCIKEGVIIYQGLNYDNTPNTIASWNKELVCYLEVDVLFHFANFNGAIFRNSFMEFYNLTEKVNEHKGSKLIKLRYLKETEEEFSNFFHVAEFIIEGKATLDPSNTAMNYILDGCKSVADVQEKKSDFIQLLKDNNIILETKSDYYDDPNHKYNLEVVNPCEEYGIPESEKNTYYLGLLSHINIKRKANKATLIQHTEFILISDNSKINNIAKCIANQDSGYSIFLSSTLMFITTKLWVQLNAGLGFEKIPISFSMITKSQILLSKHLSEKIAGEYEKLIKSRNKGEISDETIKRRYSDLATQSKKPEEIIKDEIEEVLYNLRYDNMIEFMKNFESEIERHKKTAIDNKGLMEITKNQGRDIIEKESIIETTKTIASKKNEIALKLCKEKLDEMEILKDDCSRRIQKKKKLTKFIISLLYLIYVVILISLITSIGWSVMEPIVYILALPTMLIFGIYMIVKEKALNIPKFLDGLYMRIEKYEYAKSGFCEEKLRETEALYIELQND